LCCYESCVFAVFIKGGVTTGPGNAGLFPDSGKFFLYLHSATLNARTFFSTAAMTLLFMIAPRVLYENSFPTSLSFVPPSSFELPSQLSPLRTLFFFFLTSEVFSLFLLEDCLRHCPFTFDDDSSISLPPIRFSFSPPFLSSALGVGAHGLKPLPPSFLDSFGVSSFPAGLILDLSPRL